MNKAELIEHIAKDSDLSKAAAERVIVSMIDGVKKGLKSTGKVTILGFGTFSVSRRKAREGRDPRDGSTVQIVALNVPKFAAGKGLKEALK